MWTSSEAWVIYLCVSLGGMQGSASHSGGQVVVLSDFQKPGYWHMPKLSPPDAPIWDFESGMNGAKIYFASGGCVQSSVVVVVTLELVGRTQQEGQFHRNQAVSSRTLTLCLFFGLPLFLPVFWASFQSSSVNRELLNTLPVHFYSV